MKRLFLDKKGDEKVVSVWWFLILIITLGAIIVGVNIFFSAQADTRQAEANLLGERLFDCLISQGQINSDLVLQKEDFDVFGECGLKEEVFARQGGNFFFRIAFYDDSGKKIFDIKKGRNEFESDCEATSLPDQDGKGISAEFYPQCSLDEENASYYFYGKDGTELLEGKLEILSASNQNGERFR